MMTSRSSKIRGRHLGLALNTLIVFLAYQGIAASQEPIESSPNSPTARGSSGAEQVTNPSQNSPALVIGEGDLLQIRLYGVPDFNEHVRVESGVVSLPKIGAVKVIGLSTEQVEQIIEKELKDKGFYNNPQVTVLQQEFGNLATISVQGEVTKPGVYPVVSSRKLFDMISTAGGFTPKSGQDILITHRNQPNNVQKITLSSEPDKQSDANVEVLPGDTIVVTKAPVVYVIGDVHLPGGFVIDKNNGLTVRQALALAQGVDSTANLNDGRIIHHTEQGPKESPPIDLKKILEGKAADMKLEAGDILFIPHSASTSMMPGLGQVQPVYQDIPLIVPPPQGGRIFQ